MFCFLSCDAQQLLIAEFSIVQMFGDTIAISHDQAEISSAVLVLEIVCRVCFLNQLLLAVNGLETPFTSIFTWLTKMRVFMDYRYLWASMDVKMGFIKQHFTGHQLQVINYLEITQPRTMQISEVICRLVAGTLNAWEAMLQQHEIRKKWNMHIDKDR